MEDLPTETLILIFKNLKINELLNVGLVSRFFFLVSSDDRLWKLLFIDKFGYTKIFKNEEELIKLKNDFKNQQQQILKINKNKQNNNNNNILSTSISQNQNENNINIDHDNDISQHLLQKQINKLQISILYLQQQNLKGWKHSYKKNLLLESSNELIDSILKEDFSKTDHLLSIKLLTNNNTYLRAAEKIIVKNQPELLEKVLKYCPIDSVLGYFYIQSYMRLITIAIQRNSIACAKLLLNYGADVTYSNTGVLLMGCKNKVFPLNGEFGKIIGTFPRLCSSSPELSYYFLDALLSQITFFLCVQSGNELTLQDYVKTMRGAAFINKRTGIWDYGHEILRFSGVFNLENKKINITRKSPVINSSNININSNVNTSGTTTSTTILQSPITSIGLTTTNNSASPISASPLNSPSPSLLISPNYKSITITDGCGGGGVLGNVRTLNGSSDSESDHLSLDNMSKVRFSQFKMIEKTLSQVTLDWSSEYCSYTPLHWASKCGHLANIKTLIKMGADVNALTSLGKSSFDIAKENKNDNCLIFLEKQMSKTIKIQTFEPLFQFIKKGNYIGSLKFLSTFMFEKSLKHLEKPISTKLIAHTIEYDQQKILIGLYPLCLNVNSISDEDGNTPLHYAAALGRLECLKIIINGGEKVYNNNNDSEIYDSEINDCEDGSNININCVNKIYQTPLILATINGHFDIVKYLLENKSASVDIVDWQLNTPLHYSFKYPDIVEILLKHHSNPFQINNLSKNCLHLAVDVSKNDNRINRIKSLNILLTHIERQYQDYTSSNYFNNIFNTLDLFENTPLLISQSYYITHFQDYDNNDIFNEISNILLKKEERNNSGSDEYILSKSSKSITNQLNLSFNDLKMILNFKRPIELENYLATTVPLKPSVAMLSILKLGGTISIETFEKLKLQHHLMLESYIKKLKFLNCYNQFINIHTSSIESIIEQLLIIQQYQLKSFAYSSIEYILSVYLISNRFEIVVYLIENLNRIMNSTTYIDRFQTFIFNSILHTPSIPQKYCRSLLSPYTTRFDSSLFQHVISLDHHIMLISMITNDDSPSPLPSEINYKFRMNLAVSKYWIFSRVVKNGAVKCCRFLTDMLFNKSLDFEFTHSLLLNVSELRSIKNKREIINILSHYDSNSIIEALKDNPVSPNANAYFDFYYSLDDNNGSNNHDIDNNNSGSTISKKPLIEIDYHQNSCENHPHDLKKEYIEICPNQCGVKNILDLDDHLLICLNGFYNCPNKINGCQSEPMSKSNLLNHLQKQCTYLHCHQCDGSFNRQDFVQHIFTHESDTWEICSFCNQMIKGFSSTYKNDIIHIRDCSLNLNNSNNNNNNSNNEKSILFSSEYEHLKVCKNHNIKCHSCKITIHISELSTHKCLFISKIPILRNYLNIQNLVDLI
ncbi:hypothetical protein ACTFIW_002128 [Dictyostelium discoideum]